MNVKNYVNDELSVLLEYLMQNKCLQRYIVSLGKNNSEDIKATDCYIQTILSDKPLKVEIKMESFFALKSNNFTLDAISMFYPKEEIVDYKKRFLYNDFLEIVDIDKKFLKGNFYTSDADIVLKKIDGFDRIYAYNNHGLKSQEFIDYVENHCQLKINPKKEYDLDDKWDSAFYLIKKYDKNLINCEIKTEKDFLNLVKEKDYL